MSRHANATANASARVLVAGAATRDKGRRLLLVGKTPPPVLKLSA